MAMIEFKTRVVGHYMNLEIRIDNVRQDLGLLDQIEIKNLITDLEEAIEDIKTYVDDNNAY